MPPPLSPRQRKLLEMQALGGPQGQARPDVMQQMMQLYGLAQADEQGAQKLVGQALQNDIYRQQLEQEKSQAAWADPMARALYETGDAQRRLLGAQATAAEARARGDVTPEDRMRFEMMTGQPYVSPEEKMAGQKQKDLRDWYTMEADFRNAKDGQVPPEIRAAVMGRFPESMPWFESLLAGTAPSTPMPETYGDEIQQGVTGLAAAAPGAFGEKLAALTAPVTYPFRQLALGLRTKRGEPIGEIPFVPERGNFWGTKR